MFVGTLALLAPWLAGEECRAILDRARGLYESRQYDDAAMEFRRAVPACDQKQVALMGLGKTQLLGGKFADAIVTLDTLLSRQPKNAEAMKLKADAQYFLGRDHDAEETLLHAIDLDARNGDAIYALGRIYYQQSRYDRAIEQFRKALALDPKSYKAYDNLGLCYEGLNDNQQALRNFLSALELVSKDHPEYDSVYGNLANLMLKIGNYSRAFDLGVEAARRNPDSARNCFLTGKALTKLDKYDLSVRWLKRAGELDPDYPEPHYMLGQVYNKLGRKDEARQEFQAFQEIIKRVPRRQR